MDISLATRAYSQLNNTSSLWLFGVKDAADITGRVGMAYHEGYKGKTQESIESGKHEARERFIDEFGGSIAWLGGVPLFRWIYDKTVFKALKLDPKIHLKKILLDKDNIQAFSENAIDKFDNKILKSAPKYQKTHIGKVLFSTVIPCLTIAFALPRLNKWLTATITGKEQEKRALNAKRLNAVRLSKNAEVTFSAFNSNKAKNKDQINFKGGLFDIPGKLINMAQGSQLSPVNSMLAIDLGISSGRVFSYDRKPQERYETAFKEAGIIFFFFVASDYIKKGIESVSKKFFKTPIHLDPTVLEDDNFKKFINEAKTNTEILNKFPAIDTSIFNPKEFNKLSNELQKKNLNEVEETVINFINDNLKENGYSKEKGFKNYILEAARKSGLIDIVEKDGKFITNPDKFIETKQVAKVFEHLKDYIKTAPLNDSENFFKKTKKVKRAGIVVNILICNAFLGYILPKMQYLFREKRTGTNLFPAVQDHLEAKSLSR